MTERDYDELAAPERTALIDRAIFLIDRGYINVPAAMQSRTGEFIETVARRLYKHLPEDEIVKAVAIDPPQTPFEAPTTMNSKTYRRNAET